MRSRSQFFGKSQQICGFFILEILQLHRLQAFLDGHGIGTWSKGGIGSMNERRSPGRDHRRGWF
jgi:hypothetical protein